jgi:hypothetical protein
MLLQYLKFNFFPCLPQLFNHDQRTLDIRDLGFQSLTPTERNEMSLKPYWIIPPCACYYRTLVGTYRYLSYVIKCGKQCLKSVGTGNFFDESKS